MRRKTIRRHVPWSPDPDYDYKHCGACGKPGDAIVASRETNGALHFIHPTDECRKALRDKLAGRPEQLSMEVLAWGK